MQTTSNVNINKIVPLKTVNMESPSINENENSSVIQNSPSSDSASTEQSNLTEASTPQNSSPKLGNRKKLYTDTNSPIDIAYPIYNNMNRTFETKQELHPALHNRLSIIRRYRIYRRNKKKRLYIFNNMFSFLNNVNNDKQFVAKKKRPIKNRNYSNEIIPALNVSQKCGASLITNFKIVNNLVTNHNLTERNYQCTDKYLSTNQYLSTENNKVSKFNNSELNLKIFNTKQCQQSHDATKKITVRLKRLSQDDIQKYKKSNEAVTSSNNLNLVVRLERLSNCDVQKHKKSNKKVPNLRNLNVVVRLKRLSKSDVQKYMKSNKKTTS
ncbi:protein PFF0380w-like [Colletes gigas]|uniref:protein PFF0380w-like n=1 Tax=Colletes gigas TaxID=935657 RepID=UPI001C9A5597|nr:protein PFF0380w-like [Colletes gigas]XP_043259544.1 protein PFF0380w-like [Colletes gigas]